MIKLSRIGKKKAPMYRLVVVEKAQDPYGRVKEIVGFYNPFTKELQAKKERIEYWISQGVGLTPTVNNLLLAKEIIKGEKVKVFSISKKRAEKIKGKEKSKAEKIEKESVAKEEPAKEEAVAVEVEPVVETPVEEGKAE